MLYSRSEEPRPHGSRAECETVMRSTAGLNIWSREWKIQKSGIIRRSGFSLHRRNLCLHLCRHIHRHVKKGQANCRGMGLKSLDLRVFRFPNNRCETGTGYSFVAPEGFKLPPGPLPAPNTSFLTCIGLGGCDLRGGFPSLAGLLSRSVSCWTLKAYFSS